MRSPTRRSPRSCARSSSTACVTPRRRRGMTERAVAARAALAESSPSEGRGLLLGLIGVAVFSLTLPMTRLAMADSDPVVFGLGRSLLAPAVAAVILLATRQRRPPGGEWRPLALVAPGAIFCFPPLLASGM